MISRYIPILKINSIKSRRLNLLSLLGVLMDICTCFFFVCSHVGGPNAYCTTIPKPNIQLMIK